MSEFTKLRWKYFWQQKWKEIKPVFTPLSVILGMFLIGFGLGFPDEVKIYSIKMIIAGAIIFCFWILVGISILIKIFFKWIKSNWQKATERAIHKLGAEELVSGGDLE